MPILRGVASPGHLHIHELICRKNGHNLIVDLWLVLEGVQREADSLITDAPHDHVFTIDRLGLVANQLPPTSSHPPQCRGTG